MALVDVRRDGEVAVLTLNRPEKLNALSTAVERDLEGALSSNDVRDARAVLVHGEGRAFSAGADVTEMGDQTPADIARYYRETGDVYERLAALPIPTVAAIHGYCLGGGLEMALACDLRIAEQDAVFGLPEVAIGILPSSGGTLRLVRAVGPARAKELILWRHRFSADEALRFGLVAEVVPDGDALERGLAIAQELAALPTLAVEFAKRAVDASAEASREAAILIERLAYAALAQTPEHSGATREFGDRKD
jgi:enoyl-CoA hydratase/carnithine racemase